MEQEADTVVKMALETLCKSDTELKVEGRPLLDILREKAMEIHQLVSVVSHFINLQR